MKRPQSPRVGLLAVLFAAVAAITCSDTPTGPATGLRGLVGLAPVFSKSAEDVYRNLVSFQMAVNNVRVRLLRADGEVALDTVVTVPAGTTEITLELTVELEQQQETFDAAIELRDGPTVLFSGTQTVTARAGAGSSSNSATVPLEYTGPGATVTTLDILPDTSIVTPDSLVMRSVAVDQNNQPVTSLNLQWSVDDATRATITSAGVLKPVGPRGNVVVTAALPTQISATATVQILSRPTTVAILGGANQTAPVATTLPNAIEIEVRAADNLPVSAHPITFSYSGTNGTLFQSGAVTDANGRANASINVGTLAGAHTVTITAAGIAPITTDVTVTPGVAAAIVASAGAALTDTAGATVASAQLPTVTVRDAFGNVIANAQVKFRRHGGTGATINAQPDTMVLVNSDANGVAALTGRRLQTVASPPQDTVLATVAGVNDTIRFVATTTAGAANQLAFTQQPSNATSGDIIAPAVTVRVRDQFGNPVTTGTGATAAVTLSLSGGTTGATLGPNTASLTQTAVNGVATFNVNVNRAGTGYQLVAAATGGGLQGATSTTFDVGAGAATSVVAQTNQTVTDSAGASLVTTNLPSVLVRNANSIGVPGVEVKFRRHSGANGTINAQPDTLALVTTDANGIAALTGRRLQTLVGFDTVLVTAAGLNDTLRFAATVNHASATQLVYATQPVGGTAGSTMPDFTVEVRDQFGNRVTTGVNATKSIALTLTGATLGGPTTVSAVAGVATFSGVSVTPAGSPYQITAASAPLTSATSANFAMTSPAPVTRTWASAATGAWETATNWSGGVVPGPQDTVVINASGTFSVGINSAVSIARLILGGGSGVNALSVIGVGASLTVSDSIIIAPSGALILGTTGGGTQLTSGPVLVNGILQWVQGTVAGTGNIRILQTATMILGGSGPTTLNGRTIDNLGTLVFSGADPNALTLQNGATIENTGEFLFQGSSDIVQGTGAAGSFLNVGSVRKVVGDAATTTIGVAFNNSGTATLEIQTGTLAFTGPSLTNAATATIRGAGTLDVSNSGTTFTNAGTLSPGFSPGALGVTGNLPMQGTSKLAIDIGGTTPGTDHDVLDVSGNAALNGTLEVMLQSFSPALGQSFTVMEFASRSGTFANMTGLDIGGGLRLDPQFTATELRLVVVSNIPTATIQWTNVADGNWSTPGNWTPNRVPTSSDVVGITAAGDYTVTLDVDATIAGLLVGGTSGTQLLTGTGRALTINGNSFVDANGRVTLISSNLDGTGTFSNTGETTLQNTAVAPTVTIGNDFILRLRSSTVINGPITTTENSWIIVDGAGGVGAASVDIVNGFTNEGRLDLTSSGGTFDATLSVLNGTLVNSSSGQLFTLGAGARTLAAQLDNEGYFEPNVPLTINKAGADHVNSGSIDFQADLTITQSGSTPSFTNTSTGELFLADNLVVTGGTLFLNEGFITGPTAAGIVVTGATLSMSPSAVNGMALTLNSTTFSSGSLTIPDGQVVKLRNSTVAEPVTVQAGGTLYTFGTTGLTTLNLPATTSTLSVQAETGAATLTVTNPVTNSGVIELLSDVGSSVTLAVPNGSLTNLSGAFINSETGDGGSRFLQARLNNQGTVNVNRQLELNLSDADHVNSGTINVSGGNLIVIQSGSTPTFTNAATGTITLAASRTLTVENGVLSFVAGSLVTGTATSRLITTGAVALSFTPANFATLPVQLSSATTISGGTVTIESGKTLNLMGIGTTSTLAAAVAIQTGGVLLLNGSVNLNGAVSIASGGIFRVKGQTTGGNASTVVTTGFVNEGTIELTSDGQQAVLDVSTGSVQNNNYAVIRTLGSGLKRLGAQLLNQLDAGVEIGSGSNLTIDRAAAQHTNGGLIDATNGNLTLVLSGTAPSFTNLGGGSVTLGTTSGRTWTVTVNSGTTSALLDLQSGLVSGGANTMLVTSGSALSLALAMPVVANGMPLRLGSNTTLDGALTIGGDETLELLGTGGTSTLNGTLTITSGGLLVLRGSTTLTNAPTINSGGIMRVLGETFAGGATATVNTAFTNSGTIELTSTDNAAATLTVTAGSLTNLSGAFINALAGVGGARTLRAALNNAGTLSVATNLEIDKLEADHVNSGTVTLSTGNLTVTQTGTDPTFTNTGASAQIIISGSRSLIVSGGALLNQSSGAIIGIGTINVATSAFTNDAVIRPAGTGAIGTMTITGNFTQTANGDIEIEMASNTSSDVLAISGTATLAGEMPVSGIGGYTIQDGFPWTVMTYLSRLGTVAVNGPAAFMSTYNSTNLQIQQTS